MKQAKIKKLYKKIKGLHFIYIFYGVKRSNDWEFGLDTVSVINYVLSL